MPKPIKFRTRIGHHAKLNMHYLEIPARAIRHFGGKFTGRFVCAVNGTLRFQGGLVALGGGKGYITLSKARMKKLDASPADPVVLELRPDPSKLGMEIPEELRALLGQDAEAKRRFGKLVPGKRRYIAYYVGLVKNTNSRLERAIRIIENLKLFPPEKISFRQMLGFRKTGEKP